jgi:serine/threonine-protein kinase
MAAVRESIKAIRAPGMTAGPQAQVRAAKTRAAEPGENKLSLDLDEPPTEPRQVVDPGDSPFERKTGEYGQTPSYVESHGVRQGPWSFARVVEACITGQIGPGDRVDYMGRGMKVLEEIEELARFLPPKSVTTNNLTGPGQPDFTHELSPGSMLEALVRVFEQKLTGVLFAERQAGDDSIGARKELYFIDGKLHHVASSDASELLGEYLVRRGKLAREELDLALAVLPRYGGRMGDTLISLGLVGPVDIFRGIRDQGRDRVADLFLWRGGELTFYENQKAPHVEFPLDLDLPTLMVAGLESAYPAEAPIDRWRDRLDKVLLPKRGALSDAVWPAVVQRLQALVTSPMPLREVLKAAARAGAQGAGDALRAVEILLAAGLLAWQ